MRIVFFSMLSLTTALSSQKNPIFTPDAEQSLYLQPSQWIDSNHSSVRAKAIELAEQAKCEDDIVRRCFEFVRDSILHTGDYRTDAITCKASDVLREGTGYCYAKSHLLAALLRANGIAAGLCYQRLTIADDDSGPPYCLHGLNAVYLAGTEEWYRVDPRGLKETARRAEYSPPKEKLAYPVRPEIGEEDFRKIYAEPLPIVVETLTTRTDSWSDVMDHLPDSTEMQ